MTQTHEFCMPLKVIICSLLSLSLSLSLLYMDPTDSDSDLFFDALDSFETLEEEEEEETVDSSELIKTLPVDDDGGSRSALTLDPPPPSPPSLLRLRQSRDRRSRILHRSRHDSSSQLSAPSLALGQSTAVSRDETPEGPSLLLSIAGFVIKSIFFQLNLLISCVGIPFTLLKVSFLAAADPFGTVNKARNAMEERFLSVWNGLVGSRQDLGKLVGRFALGCFWSAYVGFILVGILVAAFLGGVLVMKRVVEEPLLVERDLNFDYTKPSPDALVAIDSRGDVDCQSIVLGNKDGIGMPLGSRALQKNHRLQLVVSLVLPESDYNRKLGMFQVRAELLSASGKVTHSSSQPCMLRFKSPHIRFVETFLKTGTLLAGYSSESQIINIKMTGFVEGNDPTVCVRIIIEQRAEYKPGAGIPEIYAASLKLESQLPLMKRMIWNWRITVFIWVVMMLFVFELLIVLVCCRPLIIPRTRTDNETPNRPPDSGTPS